MDWLKKRQYRPSFNMIFQTLDNLPVPAQIFEKLYTLILDKLQDRESIRHVVPVG